MWLSHGSGAWVFDQCNMWQNLIVLIPQATLYIMTQNIENRKESEKRNEIWGKFGHFSHTHERKLCFIYEWTNLFSKMPWGWKDMNKRTLVLYFQWSELQASCQIRGKSGKVPSAIIRWTSRKSIHCVHCQFHKRYLQDVDCFLWNVPRAQSEQWHWALARSQHRYEVSHDNLISKL